MCGTRHLKANKPSSQISNLELAASMLSRKRQKDKTNKE